MNRLQAAMNQADVGELEAEADAIGREAVQNALAEPADMARVMEHAREIELQRQRDLDAALADAVEVVARQRARLGRRICSRHDGETVRRVFELLRALMPDSSADADPSFQ